MRYVRQSWGKSERACLHWADLACFATPTVRPASSQPPLFLFVFGLHA